MGAKPPMFKCWVQGAFGKWLATGVTSAKFGACDRVLSALFPGFLDNSLASTCTFYLLKNMFCFYDLVMHHPIRRSKQNNFDQ